MIFRTTSSKLTVITMDCRYFDLCNANNPIKGLDLNYGFQSADS